MEFVNWDDGSCPLRSIVSGISTHRIHSGLGEEQVTIPTRVISMVGIPDRGANRPSDPSEQGRVVPKMRPHHVEEVGLRGGILGQIAALQVTDHRMSGALL